MMLRWRIIFAILGSIGMAIIYGLKVNLSMAIVPMVNQTSANSVHESHDVKQLTQNSTTETNDEDAIICKVAENKEEKGDSKNVSTEISAEGTFFWTKNEQGLVLGSYFWGYFVTQVPGGRIAELFSGKWVFFSAVLLNVFGTLATPFASNLSYIALIFMRILEGFGGGVTFPAMNVIIAAWAPDSERSTISSLIYGGTAIGTVISLVTSGLIASHPSLGWEAIFYLHGGLSLIWCILWVVCVSDTPQKHPFISDTEKEFIMSDQASRAAGKCSTKKNNRVPWSQIATSIPFWALLITHTLNNFGWYMLLVELPMFLSVGLGFAIKDNAVLSALPFLCNWLFSILYSSSLDKAIAKQWITRTNGRKLSQLIASIIPAICLIGVCLSGCDRKIVVPLMIIATTFFGSMFSGVFSNHTDIASNYAGVLMGITNMAATIPGFLVPAVVGALTHGKEGIAPWHTAFYLTAGLLLFESLVFGLFASGVEQPWNRQSMDNNAEMKLEENEKQERNESVKAEEKPMLATESC